MPKKESSSRKEKIPKTKGDEDPILRLFVRRILEKQREEKTAEDEGIFIAKEKEREREDKRLLKEIGIVKWTIFLSLAIIILILLGAFSAGCFFKSCSFPLQNSREIVAGAFSLITLALGYLFGRGSR